MCISLEWQAERPRKPEVSYLDCLALFVDKKVAWLEVSVHDPSLVAVKQALEHLPYDRSDVTDFHRRAFLVEILLHVLVEKLEDQIQLILSMNDINQTHDSWMVKFPE